MDDVFFLKNSRPHLWPCQTYNLDPTWMCFDRYSSVVLSHFLKVDRFLKAEFGLFDLIVYFLKARDTFHPPFPSGGTQVISSWDRGCSCSWTMPATGFRREINHCVLYYFCSQSLMQLLSGRCTLSAQIAPKFSTLRKEGGVNSSILSKKPYLPSFSLFLIVEYLLCSAYRTWWKGKFVDAHKTLRTYNYLRNKFCDGVHLDEEKSEKHLLRKRLQSSPKN